MAYNLPPAWDPGFVLPKNVRDEGMERRAFITKMLPRGSYSQPKVGTGGYAVPEYIEDEGYGQGTYTTFWQRSGTYNGPRIPNFLNRHPKVTKAAPLPGGAGHTYTIQTTAPAAAMSGDEPMHPVFEDYGQKAASLLIARVAPLPPAQRGPALRKILDAVDKSLWTRTQDIWKRYVAQGVDKAAAFPQALSRAMSTGIAAEIIHAGIHGAAPQARSLLGLGCYGGSAALGADAAPATVAPVTATPAGCKTSAGYSWIYGAPVNGVYAGGYWVKTAPGQADVPRCPSGPPAGAATAATEAAAGRLVVRTGAIDDLLGVGPFQFKKSQLRDIIYQPNMSPLAPDLMFVNPDVNAPFTAPAVIGSPVRGITPQILAWLGAKITKLTDDAGKPYRSMKYGDLDTAHCGTYPDAAKWFTAMGITPTTPLKTVDMRELACPGMTLSVSTLPTAVQLPGGETRLMLVGLVLANARKPYDATNNPTVLKVWLVKPQGHKSWTDALLDLLNPLQAIQAITNPLAPLQTAAGAAAAVNNNVVIPAVNDLGNLACGVLSSDVGQIGAATAAAAAGVPPQAGVAGARVAAQSCGHAPPPAATVAARSSLLPLAIIGGGGLLAILLMSGGRRQAP